MLWFEFFRQVALVSVTFPRRKLSSAKLLDNTCRNMPIIRHGRAILASLGEQGRIILPGLVPR